MILGQRTAVVADLGVTPAELVFGADPRLPGDLATGTDTDIQQLIQITKAAAERSPEPTSHHAQPKVSFTKEAKEASHVYIKNHKVNPLQQAMEGPFPIVERLSNSCIRVEVGTGAITMESQGTRYITG